VSFEVMFEVVKWWWDSGSSRYMVSDLWRLVLMLYWLCSMLSVRRRHERRWCPDWQFSYKSIRWTPRSRISTELRLRVLLTHSSLLWASSFRNSLILQS